MKRFLSLLSIALVGWCLGTTRPAHGQTPAMSLMGSVQTDTKEPLAGAAITVIHLPSGVRHAVASDGGGRFVVANLLGGGPYLIRVEEGGYRSQTVENIFLENGKTTNFTVLMNKLGQKPSKSLSRRLTEQPGPTLALAPEAVVGGPVLITTLRKSRSGTGRAALPTPVAAAPAPAALPPAALATPVPLPAPDSAAPAAEAAAAAPVPASAPRPARNSASYAAYRPMSRVPDIIVPGHYDARSGNYLYDTGPRTTLKLAGGGVVAGVGSNSTESHLYHFLADPQMQVDTVDLTKGWYNFDRVYFEAGQARLTPESIGQLRNVATILQAYPRARIKLGGYTDSTGTDNVNRQLSEARARTAWASLVEMGISPSRIDARGYGRNYAIAANDSEEGRAKNRRLSVKVLKK